jgi:carbonic anhydrase
MNEKEYFNWCKNVDKVFYSQILLDRLKENKKLNRKQEKEIRKKIKKLRYANILKSPYLEGKENLKIKALVLCFKDYCSFMGITKNTSFS